MPVPPPEHAERVFRGILADVYQWDQELYDGSHTTFECYTRADTVAVLAFLDPRTLLLTRQMQPGHGDQPFWDPPGGRVDPGETFEQAAERELEEETGYRAGRMKVWTHARFEGMTRFEELVFVAADLTTCASRHHDAGERIEVVPVEWNAAVQMCLKREWRRQDAMLAVLGMHFDPEMRRSLEQFLRMSTRT